MSEIEIEIASEKKLARSKTSCVGGLLGAAFAFGFAFFAFAFVFVGALKVAPTAGRSADLQRSVMFLPRCTIVVRVLGSEVQ